MSDELEAQKLEIRKLERRVIENDIVMMLLKFEGEVLNSISIPGTLPDADVYARKIVAYLREHLIH
jgi:hypothetical protein